MSHLTSRLKPKPVQLFVSYSHLNSVWFAKLRPLLKFRAPTQLAHVWHDQQLAAGDHWDQEIRVALKEMDVFICLVSYEFLDSDYITQIELNEALKRNKKKEVEIVPVLLYEMNLEADCPDLHKFNPLPAFGKCWRDYEKDGGHYQDAHKPIRDGLRAVIDKVRARRC
jgi:hypothetical protein